jgi:hypothetical protein
MKFKYIYLLAVAVMTFASCKKDLGNYNYHPVSEPVLEGINGASFSALIGDSLIIKPKVTFADADPAKDLDFEWKVLILEDLKELTFKGNPLRMLYNLGPGERTFTLTVTDKRNGLKYKFTFKVTGTTQFSKGVLVLSADNGVGKLSFVKPDNTVLVDLYQGLNGKALPGNPLQLYYSKPLPYQLLTKEEYWILSDDPKGGVIVDASTLLRKNDFSTQFFLPPSAILPGFLEPVLGTVPNGVINGKLYVGVQSTAPFAPDYGKFANEQSGDYVLSKYFTHGSTFYFGFDTKAKAFVVFNSDGTYVGTKYTVPATPAFDPKNIGMSNLIYMKGTETGTNYAFFKEAEGSVYELKFNYTLNSTDKEIAPQYKRVFKGSSMVTADTKWVRNSLNVFYFSSGDKIYRYNPINEDIKQLDGTFGGKKVTMIQISSDDNELIVGTEGSVYALDVTVGKNGNITQTINGIPGAVVDLLIK